METFAGLPDNGLGPSINSEGPRIVYVNGGWRRVPTSRPPVRRPVPIESPVFAPCCTHPKVRGARLHKALDAVLGAYGWLSGNPLR